MLGQVPLKSKMMESRLTVAVTRIGAGVVRPSTTDSIGSSKLYRPSGQLRMAARVRRSLYS